MHLYLQSRRPFVPYGSTRFNSVRHRCLLRRTKHLSASNHSPRGEWPACYQKQTIVKPRPERLDAARTFLNLTLANPYLTSDVDGRLGSDRSIVVAFL